MCSLNKGERRESICWNCPHCNAYALLFFTFTLSLLQHVLIELASTSGLQMPCDFSSRHKKAGSCQEHLDVCIAFLSNIKCVSGSRGSLIYYCTSYTHKNNLFGWKTESSRLCFFIRRNLLLLLEYKFSEYRPFVTTMKTMFLEQIKYFLYV